MLTDNEVLNLKLEREFDPYMSHDQVFDSSPVVFPTLTLELLDMEPLNRIADKIRVENGCLPCYDESGEFDSEGYYRFFVTFYGVWPGCENCIVVNYLGGHGEMEEFQIDLTEEQRLALFAMLNRECEELFDESAVDQMVEYAQDELLGWRGMRDE